MKKMVEDQCVSEDIIALSKVRDVASVRSPYTRSQYLCWENADVSLQVLRELMWQVMYSQLADLRLYLVGLTELTLLQDSWTSARIQLLFSGVS